jgi:hypothetical protein
LSKIMSEMFKEAVFEDIRPYLDDEINPALRRIVAVPVFEKILEFLFPDQNKNQIKAMLTKTYTAHDFQVNFMHPLVNSIVNKTSKGLTYDGFEQLTPGTPYLFVANHRDIVLDSAMLQVLLLDNQHSTSEITFGSNLMANPFIIDLGKVNRMFKVYRGGNKMELFKNSKILSAYIRYTLTHKKVSIWIAQRNGRTKDGNDKTESGIFKMFNISGNNNFYQSFKELNIVPLSVSYEYEPCCTFKIKELYAALDGSYQKKPDEDFLSIITGITQPKGRIHMSVGKPVNHCLKELEPITTYNNKINRLVELFDDEIYNHYKLWPNNYIACDHLYNSRDYETHYTARDKKVFLEYMENEIRGLAGERKKLEELFLKIYANPLMNINRLQ